MEGARFVSNSSKTIFDKNYESGLTYGMHGRGPQPPGLSLLI